MNGRVLQLITDTDRRGAQVFATDLAPALEELGWYVRTVALGPGTSGLLDVPVLGPTRRSLSTFKQLRRLAKNFDVVIAHGSTTLPVSALGLAGTGVPFVYRQISDSLFWAHNWFRRTRVRLALRRASLVVALWHGSADVLAEEFGVPRDKIEIVPNGVPAEGFRPHTASERIEATERLGLPPDARVVAYVGALVPEKGVDIAIRALESISSAHFLVVGDGPMRQELEDLSADLLAERAHFAGYLGDVRSAYAAADLIVLPSRGGDSMPAVLIEAGLSATPVIATPEQGIVDIVEDGRTGWLVPVDDASAMRTAIGKALGSEERLREVGRSARERCLSLFSIQAVARGWHSTLEHSLDKK